MARRSVALLQRELTYAQARQTYLATPRTRTSTTVVPNPKTLYGYRSTNLVVGSESALIKIKVENAAITKFTEAALGLTPTSNAAFASSAIPIPRKFKPAKVHALFGATTPTVQTAKTSGRQYIKYSAATTGASQSTYSAAISKEATAVTEGDQRTAAEAIATTLKDEVGEYGRIWFTPEYLAESL